MNTRTYITQIAAKDLYARVWLVIVAIGLILASWRLHAIDRVQMTVADLAGPGLSADGITVEMNFPDSRTASVLVHFRHAKLAELGTFKDVAVSCAAPLIKEPTYRCERAQVHADSVRFGPQTFTARIAWNSKLRELSFAANGVRLASGFIDADGRWSPKSWSVDVVAKGLAIEPARTLLGDLSPLGKNWTLSGTIDRLHAVMAGGTQIERIDIAADISATNFGNADGTIAAERLGASADIKARRSADGWRVDVSGGAHQGEVLYGRIYWNFEREPAQLQASAAGRDAATVAIGISRVRLGKMLSARGSGVIRLTPAVSLRAIGLDVGDLDLASIPLQTRDGLFAGTPISQIQGQGHASGRIEIDDDAPALIDLTLNNVQLRDAVARLGVAGLEGHLLWHSVARLAELLRSGQAQDLASRLSWQSGNLYGVAVGGATVRLATTGADLRLLEPIKIPILDGGLSIKLLQLRRLGDAAMSVRFDALIDPISVPLLCKAFGWPEFAGQLSGRIPNLSLEQGEMTLGGNLDASMFDGRVVVSQLKLRDLFGARPRLQASVLLNRLDLAAITGAFSVGKITGRVDGEINDLELVGWEPTAFDARIYSTPHDRTKKRISQSAVETITSIGGGAAAVLQRGALRFFKEFNYAKLGISCKLVNDVCIMNGIEPHPPGYYLVKGSGLPRIDVLGNAERVDWLRLVASLKELPNSHPSIGNSP